MNRRAEHDVVEPEARPHIPTPEKLTIRQSTTRRDAAAEQIVARLAAETPAVRRGLSASSTARVAPARGRVMLVGAVVIVFATGFGVHRAFPAAPLELIALALLPSVGLGALAFLASQWWLNKDG